MSQTLPSVSLASVTLGQVGTVSLKNVGPDANPSFTQNTPHLQIHNESGVGLQISFQTGGNSFYLPAGGWVTVPIVPGESQLIWQVQYILNVVGGAPVSQLLVTYYPPNEQVPNIPQLGNSPIGGSVGTSSIQTLSNEGNAANTLVIDIGDAALAQLWQIFTNKFSISVDQSGVAHTVLQGNASGNPLQLGKAGDNTEVLGALLVDQLLTMASNGLTVPAATDAVYNVPTGQKHNFEVNAVSEVTINANSLTSGVGVNTNTIRDNVTGTTQITLATAGLSIPNAIQSILTLAQYLGITGKVTATSGTTSGTATLYEMVSGTGFKVALVDFNNFRNGTASVTNVNLIATWNKLAFAFSTDIGRTSFANSGSGITMGQLSVLGTGTGGGTVSNQTIMGNNEIAGSNSSFAQVQYAASDPSAHNGILLMIGS